MMFYTAITTQGCNNNRKSNAAPETNGRPEIANKQRIDSTTCEGMVHLNGGSYQMGSNDPDFPDTKPLHKVILKSFWIDRHEVTNAQYQKFVNATHYLTVAEQKPDPAEFPGIDPSRLVPGSAVFTPPNKPVSLDNPMQWWRYVPTQIGNIRMGQKVPLKDSKTIRWCMSVTKTHLPMPSGQASGCRPKLNGSLQHVAERPIQLIIGVTNYIRPVK